MIFISFQTKNLKSTGDLQILEPTGFQKRPWQIFLQKKIYEKQPPEMVLKSARIYNFSFNKEFYC